MSHQMVGVVIEALLTDEDLRDRFAVNPIETLVNLNFLGFDLTRDEIEVFAQTDARLWSLNRELFGRRSH